MAAKKNLRNFSGDVLIGYGDMPFLTAEGIGLMVELRAEMKYLLSVLYTQLHYAHDCGFGRIIRDAKGDLLKIIEEKDASELQRKITEVNTGVYLVEREFLFSCLSRVGVKNKQKEYYLTDIVEIARQRNAPVEAVPLPFWDEAQGVNDREELTRAESWLRHRINRFHQINGVTIRDPDTTFIEPEAAIASDAVIGPQVHLTGKTKIGEDVIIETGCQINDSIVERGAILHPYCVLDKARVGPHCEIGPFARLRPETVLAEGVKIGNFVETKKAKIGKGTKANHLTYLGDAEIGEGCNIGCGTITCNYDGAVKHKTILGDEVFIGSDVQLVAPVKVGQGAYIGAGTTVTKDIPPDALALSRAPQQNIEGWAIKKRERLKRAKKEKK
jgi:bifunctional UDP-N-acetylglucosamine pyrophosphorylase/glucosamine-1-phosphate N-acetyltransferase